MSGKYVRRLCRRIWREESQRWAAPWASGDMCIWCSAPRNLHAAYPGYRWASVPLARNNKHCEGFVQQVVALRTCDRRAWRRFRWTGRRGHLSSEIKHKSNRHWCSVGFGVDACKRKYCPFPPVSILRIYFLNQKIKNKQNVDTYLCCGKKPLATLVHAGPVPTHLYI